MGCGRLCLLAPAVSAARSRQASWADAAAAARRARRRPRRRSSTSSTACACSRCRRTAPAGAWTTRCVCTFIATPSCASWTACSSTRPGAGSPCSSAPARSSSPTRSPAGSPAGAHALAARLMPGPDARQWGVLHTGKRLDECTSSSGLFTCRVCEMSCWVAYQRPPCCM